MGPIYGVTAIVLNGWFTFSQLQLMREKNDAGGTTLIMRKRIPESSEEGDFL